MTLPSDDFLDERLKELNRNLVEAQRADEERAERSGVGRRATDHDWRRWLANHLPALFGILSCLLVAVGWLGGRVLSSDARAIAGLEAKMQRVLDKQEAFELERAAERYRVAQFAAIAQQTSNRLDELLPHLYASLRADAMDRGDTREAEKLGKKLKAAIADSKASGQ